MNNRMRKVTVYLNSPRVIEIGEEIISWGQLKSILVEEYGYDNNIVGSVKDLELTNPEDLLPTGEFTISLIITKSKYGK